jgi:glycerophosphoryl diester phosphodiesterase
MKTQFIAHRGSSALATENTLESINLAVKAQVQMIEIDIRETRDGKFVLSHDSTTERIFKVDLSIHQHTLKELQALCPQLVSLDEAIRATKTTPLVIELKSHINIPALFALLKKYPSLKYRIASFHSAPLKEIKTKYPSTFAYLLEHHSPFDAINRAKAIGADGIGYNFSLINPLTYLLCRHNKLQLYAYTVNHPVNVWFLRTLYPKVAICTDNPNRFIR